MDEKRVPTLARPPMAQHTLQALCGSYVRYLMQRTGKSAETIGDRFYTETGGDPERNPAEFRKWAGQKVYMLDQLRLDPFAGDAA
jgi:hypothetical protein